MAVAAAGAAASLAGAVSSKGAGFLEGFEVKLKSNFGPALADMERFNKSWDHLNKTLEPASNLWNKFMGTLDHVFGLFKSVVAPLAIAGGLFFAFLLTGSAARDVFQAFGDIVGAFADVLTGALMPAIQPVLDVLVAMIPQWQAIFGTDEWKTQMENLGKVLADLTTQGMNVLLELVKAVVDVLPTFIGFWSELVQILADSLKYLSLHPEFLQAIAQGLTIIAGTIVTLGAAGIVALFTGVALALGMIGQAVQFLVDHWSDIQGFFNTFKDSLPTLERLANLGDRLVGIFDAFRGAAAGAFDVLQKMGKIVEAPLSAGQSIGDALTSFWNNLPHFQLGGPVLETGPAIVHAGEFIVPAGGASAAAGAAGATYNVSFNVQGSVDRDTIEELATAVDEIMRRRHISRVNTLR